MPRGNNYLEDEDLILTLAWLEISQDAVVGSEQKGDNFWLRVRNKFVEIWKRRRGEDKAYRERISLRTSVALKNRWTTKINHDCQKFSANHERVTKLSKSGENEEDRMEAAQKFFVEDISWNTTKREFIYHSSWKLLKIHPKWRFGQSVTSHSATSKKRKREIDGDEEVMIDGVSSSDEDEKSNFKFRISPRPTGRKLTKLMKREAEKAERDKERSILKASERIALASERKAAAVELLCETQQASLFSVENGCTSEERESYFTLMRQRVLSRLAPEQKNRNIQ
tara:strand:+ start:450 stop:1298 length:849 start_codon:yes stop_codon:yes gene_type:complete